MTAIQQDGRGGRARAALIAAVFFAFGLLAARLLGVMSPAAPPDPPPLPSAISPRPPPAPNDAGGPRIFFDPASISLLPDASLHVQLPSAPDAGASPP